MADSIRVRTNQAHTWLFRWKSKFYLSVWFELYFLVLFICFRIKKVLLCLCSEVLSLYENYQLICENSLSILFFMNYLKIVKYFHLCCVQPKNIHSWFKKLLDQSSSIWFFSYFWVRIDLPSTCMVIRMEAGILFLNLIWVLFI